jgi:hypothetical protein
VLAHFPNRLVDIGQSRFKNDKIDRAKLVELEKKATDEWIELSR